jgi:protein gp37
MGETTKIEWCAHTFNPWWGCTRVSPGCEHCYAEDFATRFGVKWGLKEQRRRFGAKHWGGPLKWNARAARAMLVEAGRRPGVFCGSMCDVFEDRRDLDAERERLWALIEATDQLDWLLLTKRPQNMLRLAPPRWAGRWPRNVWAGCTVEDQQRADERVPELLRVPAVVRFLSCEPLLGRVDLWPWMCRRDTDGDGNCATHRSGCPRIDWVIAGGESGRHARVSEVEHMRFLLEQCRAGGVAYFGKQVGSQPQLGGVRLRIFDGKGGALTDLPEDLRVREFPRVPAAA